MPTSHLQAGPQIARANSFIQLRPERRMSEHETGLLDKDLVSRLDAGSLL